MPAEGPKTHFQTQEDRNSVLHRSSNFRQKAGYPDGETPWKNNIHHILVCCLFKQANIGQALGNDPDKTRYVNDCLWITDWNVNRSKNLMMLPLWGSYIKAYKKASLGNNPTAPAIGPNDLPAHNRDHGGKRGYTVEVKGWLKKNIWDSLNVQKEPHTVDLATVIGQLDTGETTWKGELEGRPALHGGTWNSWKTRATNSTWYMAFSMSATPKPRTAP